MIGFGTKSETSYDVIKFAIDNGYNFIDTKDSNFSVTHFKNIDRTNLFLCSKLMGEDHMGPIEACENSLINANLNYWDLYYIHTTHSFDDVPILLTYEKLLELKNIGKIKNIGLSNITYEQLESIILNSTKPDYVQIEIHPYLVEKRLVNLCKENMIKIIAHSPLGSSFCKKLLNEKILIMLATKYKKTIAQIILCWHISRGIIPIPSSTNYVNIESNLNCFFEMSQSDIDLISSLDQNKRCYIKPNHYESIGKTCQPFPSRIPNFITTGNKIIDDLNTKGFYQTMCTGELYKICNNVYKYFQNNKCNINSSNLYGRSYELNYTDKYIDSQLDVLKQNEFLNDVARQYLSRSYSTSCSLKTSFKTKNLNPEFTGLYHRDTQKQKCLKVIIYLSSVCTFNGALKVVYPENNSDKLTWYNEHNIPRTTEEQIIKHCMQENIVILTGAKFSCIFLEGSVIHSGGYVQVGTRDSIYIEFI